jgi:subtilisin family serine protease
LSWRTLFLFITLLGGLLLSPGPGPVAGAEETTYVRIDTTNSQRVQALGLEPLLSLDYGSFLWLELTAGDVERLAASGVQFTEEAQAGFVHAGGRQFDPLQQAPPSGPSSESPTFGGNNQAGFRLVQFAGPVQDQWLQQLEDAGLTVLQYYPHNTYLVWGRPEQTQAVESLGVVRWQGAFQTAFKINHDLVAAEGWIQNVDVFFYNDGAPEKTVAALEALGAKVLTHFPAQADGLFFDAIVQLDAARLPAIARLPNVLWLGYASPEPQLEDEMSAQIVAGNHPGGEPQTGYNGYLNDLGVDGSGVTWAIVDTGIDWDHPDLAPNIAGGYNFPGACIEPGQPGNDCAGGGHGTHVAGIVAGTGNAGYTDGEGFQYGLGVAPGAGLFAINSLMGSVWPPGGGWQEHSKQAVLGGAIGTNNSWTSGEGTAHGYQSTERTHDIMTRDANFDTPGTAEPLIQIFSAGNSGMAIDAANALTAPKEAKNMIVVASSNNFRAGSIDAVSSFSSRGPAVDGRWVPTITAPGGAVASTRNDEGGNCANPIAGTGELYAYCSGTSMAAPHAAGALALIAEWWRAENRGATMSPAMAKALLVNGAVDMGPADIPNVHEGWGRINVTNVIDSGLPTVYRDQLDRFASSGNQLVIPVTVADPSQPLKVTLAWSDAPGAVGANPALVNDLDLSVSHNGTLYHGNHFSGGWSTSGGAADAINNLENVYLKGVSGTVTVTVNARNIAGNGVPFNDDPTDQDFALVCSNCLYPDFRLFTTPALQSVCLPGDAAFDIDISALHGFDAPVTLSASSQPAGAAISFSANGNNAPYDSTMTISGADTAPGSYTIDLMGVAAGQTHSSQMQLTARAAAPGQPLLTNPENGSTNQQLQPHLRWSHISGASSYRLQVALDEAFDDVVYSADVTTTDHVLPTPLQSNEVYYWRVRAENVCGDSEYSEPFLFITHPEPHSCPLGSVPQTQYEEDFEGTAAGWVHGGQGDTWSLSGARSQSGNLSYHAENLGAVSDQRLTSPPVTLPDEQLPLTLQFWNYRDLESYSSGCYDGGVLEISEDGGTNWSQLPNSRILTDPYNGIISSKYSNPLAGNEAWCGNSQGWQRSVVSLEEYAGKTVQFRFRVGTDQSIQKEGWYLDDMRVQSCAALGVEIEPLAEARAGLPNTQVTHDFNVINSGGISDTYTLELNSGSWPAQLSQDKVTLGPGESAGVSIVVNVPQATESITDTFVLRATSETDAFIRDEVAIETTLVNGDIRLYLPWWPGQ